MSILYNKTFMLKINAFDVINKYHNGEFSSISLSSFSKINVNKAAIVSSSGNMITFKGKQNEMILIHRTNAINITDVPRVCPGCLRCRKLSVPVPLEMSSKVIDDCRHYTFLAEIFTCRFECSLRVVRRNRITNDGGFAKIFSQEVYENYLKTLYRLMTGNPSSELKESPNPLLLVENGGSQTSEEFDFSKNISRLPILHIAVASSHYI